MSTLSMLRFHKHGDIHTGLYRVPAASHCLTEAHDCARHPVPHEDSMLLREAERVDIQWGFHSPVYFGFASVKQARRWIYKDEWMHAIWDAVTCSEFILPREHCAVGYTQAVGRLDYAISRRDVAAEELFE